VSKKDDSLFWLIAIGALIVTGGAGVVYLMTRGFRNNNPGNLMDVGIAWNGLTGHDDAGYATFDTLQNGIRAMGKDLLSKMGRGLNTVATIVAVYAPPSDNPTADYIATVSSEMGVDPDTPLTAANLYDLVSAMIYFENGQHASAADLAAGVNAALYT
jgi:hypothetical protein